MVSPRPHFTLVLASSPTATPAPATARDYNTWTQFEEGLLIDLMADRWRVNRECTYPQQTKRLTEAFNNSDGFDSQKPMPSVKRKWAEHST
ncbi:hypothetical protein BC941DRAFT_473136 [Chlamydoabsidia padenii]|nr:hypothetical protein BC941DRAFT_473136 [Chlamydoabsidia padenii]